MAGNRDVLGLFEEMLNSGQTPEEVCRDCPELLSGVRQRWQEFCRIDAEVRAWFPDADVPAPAPPLPAGLPQLPGYEVEAVLGCGGMGVVYRAKHLRLNRPVAVKMMRAASASPQELARFHREAKAVAALQHMNIVQIHDAGDLDGRPYFIMELVEGGNLAEYLGGTPRPAREAAELLVALARAVQVAHENGIIHRDLKPANILLQTSEVLKTSEVCKPPSAIPKVADFGLAKQLAPADVTDVSTTEAGAFLGTPTYAAPEQARGRVKEVGPAADIYSLGVILYEMLTGRPPFQGATAVETLVLASEQEPVPPTRLVPRVPRDLETICLKCLEKDPPKRYPTAGALAADLERFRANEPIQARPVGRLELALRWMRRHKTEAAALAGVAFLLATLVIGSLLAAVHFRGLEREQSKLAREKAKLADEKDLLIGEKELQRLKAVRAEGRETELRRRAEKEGEEHRRNLYLTEMNLAGVAALSPSGLGRVSERLAGWGQDRSGLLGWEWYYLYGLCHRDLTTCRGHLEGVLALAWAPDGRRMASAGGDGTVCLWDAAAGEERHCLSGHRGVVSSVAWGPDGKRLASAGWDGTIKLWDTDAATELTTLRGHEGEVLAVAWNADGSLLVSGGADRTVRLWDVSGVAPPRILRGHTLEVATVACSPDGKLLASGGRDSTVRLWDVEAGRETRLLRGHINWVTRVAWGPDGKRLASASNDQTAKVWDVGSGKEQLTLRGHAQGIQSVAWNPDGTRLVTASDDQTIKIWDTSGGAESFTLRGHTAPVTSALWSPDGKRLASCGWDTTVKVWDGSPDQEVPALRGHGGAVTAVSVCRAAYPRLASAGADGAVKIWNLAQGIEQATMQGQGEVWSVTWSPDGTRLASAGNDQTVRVWDATAGKEVSCFRGHTSDVYAVAWSPDGTHVASASKDKTVRIWDVADGRLVHTCRGHVYHVYALAWSPDGKRLASAAGDLTVRLWDTTTGAEIRTLRAHTGEILSVAWSPDGRWLASAGYDETIRIWDAVTGTVVHTLRGHTARVTQVAWSPDSVRLASAGHDRTVKVWEIVAGKETLTLRGHLTGVLTVAWSPDGMAILSGGNDQAILIHDATAGYIMARSLACLPLLDQRLVAVPGNAALWRLRCGVHGQQGEWDSAAADARRYLALEPERRWLTLGAWVAGPYPADLGARYAPENGPDPAGTLGPELSPASRRSWRAVPLSDRAFVNFGPLYGNAEHISAYVLFRVYSPQRQAVAILLGSDDQVRLWLNGTRIHEYLQPRAAVADADAVPAALEAGWNTLLARVVNQGGQHALYLRLSDTPADLRRANGAGDAKRPAS